MSTYDFSSGFQAKILAYLWRDATFYTMYSDVLKPQYFESEIHIDLARIITDYYRKYETSPSKMALIEEVKTLCSRSELKKEKIESYLEQVQEMSEMTFNDGEYIKDKVVEFGQRQAMIEAIFASVDDIKAGKDFERVKTRIQEASQVGVGIDDLGTSYWENIEERLERTWGATETEKIPTGIGFLDNIMSGGLGRGELGIVIAPPGSGKTLTLVNFGAHATFNGKNVVHYSFEMSEDMITKRYDMRLAEKTAEFLSNKDNRKKAGKSLEAFKAMKRHGHLIVKDYPTRTCTPTMIKAHLTKLKMSMGFTPDLIILDYPDIMKPGRQYHERRNELEMLYEDIRAIGAQFNCAVWGASQTNRGALAKEVVTIADLAESFGKAAVADFMIALSQTKKEKRNNQVRYYVAKHRSGQDGGTVCCDIHYDRMKIEHNEEFQASFELEEDGEDFEDGPKSKTVERKVDRGKGKGFESEISNAVLRLVKEGEK